MKRCVIAGITMLCVSPAMAQSWGRGGAYTGASRNQGYFTPDQECIGVLGQFQWAATLGALVVGYLRRVTTTDKGRDCNESCAACCVTIRLGTRGDLSYNLGQVRAD